MNGHFDLAMALLKRGADQPRERWRRHAALCRDQPAMGSRARYPQPRAHDQQNATYLD